MAIIKLQGDSEKRKGIYYEVDSDLEPIGEGGTGVASKPKKGSSRNDDIVISMRISKQRLSSNKNKFVATEIK